MEKTFNSTKITFREQITMRDFQICANAVKQWQKDGDEVELAFKLFPVFCVKINDQEITTEQKRKWIEELTDFAMFSDIVETIGELQQKFMEGINEKKKMQSNMNLIK